MQTKAGESRRLATSRRAIATLSICGISSVLLSLLCFAWLRYILQTATNTSVFISIALLILSFFVLLASGRVRLLCCLALAPRTPDSFQVLSTLSYVVLLCGPVQNFCRNVESVQQSIQCGSETLHNQTMFYTTSMQDPVDQLTTGVEWLRENWQTASPSLRLQADAAHAVFNGTFTRMVSVNDSLTELKEKCASSLQYLNKTCIGNFNVAKNHCDRLTSYFNTAQNSSTNKSSVTSTNSSVGNDVMTFVYSLLFEADSDRPARSTSWSDRLCSAVDLTPTCTNLFNLTACDSLHPTQMLKAAENQAELAKASISFLRDALDFELLPPPPSEIVSETALVTERVFTFNFGLIYTTVYVLAILLSCSPAFLFSMSASISETGCPNRCRLTMFLLCNVLLALWFFAFDAGLSTALHVLYQRMTASTWSLVDVSTLNYTVSGNGSIAILLRAFFATVQHTLDPSILRDVQQCVNPPNSLDLHYYVVFAALYALILCTILLSLPISRARITIQSYFVAFSSNADSDGSSELSQFIVDGFKGKGVQLVGHSLVVSQTAEPEGSSFIPGSVDRLLASAPT